ncbi:MAG: hypothetical protein GWM92_20145, partial [Gemmatimonadetes bacterium]|nr:hypothetical protein [Gemmatimonadota bacterium]NIR81139.1 hypothetical protein [Gemmatimonadota bacterium]NIT89961.1 hypothetical protein [Gemmatimonadota bacterium]NIU33774.1 hypothetical protein [Gemmatimonadota bacterium]NIU38002.1 hypothetical protein [Gemmatimonadota bacterium]
MALQVVESLTESAGLPDWVPSFALVLLVIGLPIVMATAFVQEGMGGGDEAPATPGGSQGAPAGAEGSATGEVPGDVRSAGAPTGAGPGEAAPGPGAVDVAGAAAGPGADDSGLHHRLLTWRNAIVGGVLAFALLGVVVAGYFVMWSTGVGPVGNLVAQGVIEDGERVVLASFADATGEGLGDVVTEALRVDLSESSVLQLVEDADVEPVLARMQVEPGTPLTAELAR